MKRKLLNWLVCKICPTAISLTGGTEIQQLNQCDGPWRPTARRLAYLLSTLPKQLEIRAVSIKGQGGMVIIETYYEQLDQVHEFDLRELEQVVK